MFTKKIFLFKNSSLNRYVLYNMNTPMFFGVRINEALLNFQINNFQQNYFQNNFFPWFLPLFVVVNSPIMKMAVNNR